MEKINITDFDIMGIFNLKDITGIEKYVTKISDDNYLSRSKEYYKRKNFTELSIERNLLNNLLTLENNRRNFVILENMLNASAKVYYESLKNHILYEEIHIYAQAKNCFEEDVENIINILSDKPIKKALKNLPTGKTKTPERAIELDNKALLYLFCKTLDIPNDKHILTPGYGSLYLGQFIKTIYGCEYSNLLKSSYIQDKNEKKLLNLKTDIFDLVSNPDALKSSKEVILLDDNIGTGQTMQDIKKQLQEKNIHTLCGAVQYNWINHFKYYQGEKDSTFDIKDFEYITPFNYPGHKLMEHAIKCLQLSGSTYINYLQSKSYRNRFVNDFIGSIVRSELYIKNLNFNLYKDKSYSPTTKKMNKAIKETIFNLSGKTWFGKYKLKRNINAFKKYFLSTIPSFKETPLKIKNNDINRNNNLHKIAALRKKTTKRIDNTIGTNIENKKLPKHFKYVEKYISQKLFDR